MRCAALCLSTLLALGVNGPGWIGQPAQASSWDWALHCFEKPDLDVLHGIVQQMLKTAPVGARQEWCSTSGRRGFVYLVAGGDMAGMTTATVRITLSENGVERPWFVFRYRKDPSRGWGIVG